MLQDLPDPDPEAVARLLHLTDVSGVRFRFFPALGRVVVVVADTRKLALALRFCRSASRESHWDVELMSQEEFEHRIVWFRQAVAKLDGVAEPLADRLVSEGFLSFDDLSIIDPDDLREYGRLSDEAVERIIQQAETKAEEMHRG